MSILDDAIREHLELKRAHGADESELKRLEDEAFGPAERPGEESPFAEAPTEFLGTAVEEATPPPDGGRRMPNIADLQEPPPPPAEERPTDEPPTGEVPTDAAPAEAEAPEAEASAEPVAPEAPAEPETPADEQPAMEHETIPAPPAEHETPREPEPPVSSGPSTEEREAIAEHPTEFFDVEAELGETDTDAASEKPSPTDEQLLDSQLNEPRLAPVEPIDSEEEDEELEIADEEPSEEYEEDDFFSEQRLSDELNQALEAPVTDEHEAPPEPEPLAEPQTPPPPPRTDEPTAIFDVEAGDEEESGEHDALEPEDEEEDVLEGTPDFLEDAPDDDDLWFEQRPPKDFDFDD